MKVKTSFFKIEKTHKEINVKKEIIIAAATIIAVIMFIILMIIDYKDNGNKCLCIQDETIESADESTIATEESTTAPIDGSAIIPMTEPTTDIVDKPLPSKIESESKAEKEASDDDLDLLARTIYAESKDEKSEEHYLLAGNVVMNRVASPKYPNTIKDVIYQKGQYSPTWNGQIKHKPNQLAIDCARRLLKGERFCPEDVLFQAEFKQGTGVYKKIGKTYFCYG